MVLCVLERGDKMQRKLLTSGNVFKRTDGRWGGVVWYLDEDGERKRKSFSGTTKSEVNGKITDYIALFQAELENSKVINQKLSVAITEWLEVFKFPAVERVTYDRCEQIFQNQIEPYLGNKIVSNITAADIKKLITELTNKGYSYSTVKQSHNLLKEFFRYLEYEELLAKNPMRHVNMPKKQNFLSSQGKKYQPTCETVTVFTHEEIELFKAEAYKCYPTGTPKHELPGVYILMLNTGLRTGEVLGLRNSDIDLANKVLHIEQAVKEQNKREGTKKIDGRELAVGRPKTKTSIRTVPLNDAAIKAINEIRTERYFGENAPLVADNNGGYTRPVNLRKRFGRILEQAGIERKGLHALRHTFATTLINGIKQPDGTIKSLSPKEVADILGHTTSEITEMYYVRKDTSRLVGITDGFEM